MAEDIGIYTDLERIIALCDISDKIGSPEGLKEEDLSSFAGLKKWHDCIYKLGNKEEELAAKEKEKENMHVDRAVFVYEFIFKNNPDHIPVMQSLGGIYLAREDYEHLIPVHKKLKEKNALKGTVLERFSELLEGKRESIAYCNILFNILRENNQSKQAEVITKINYCLKNLMSVKERCKDVYDSKLAKSLAALIAGANSVVGEFTTGGVEDSKQMVQPLDSVPRETVKFYSDCFKAIKQIFGLAEEYIRLRDLLEQAANLPKGVQSAILNQINFSMEFLKYQKSVGYDPVKQHVK